MKNTTPSIRSATTTQRPLDWRWQRAERLSAPGEAKPVSDDYWSKRAVAYLDALGDEFELPQADVTTFEDVVNAWQLRTVWGDREIMVQARILAGQSTDVIARRIDLDDQAVAAYEALLFDVRGRLTRFEPIAA